MTARLQSSDSELAAPIAHRRQSRTQNLDLNTRHRRARNCIGHAAGQLARVLCLDVAGRGQRGLEPLAKPPEDALEDGIVELALVPEVVDDRGPPDPDLLGHIFQPGRLEAPLRKPQLGRRQDAPPRPLRSRRPSIHLGNLPARR